MPDADAPVPATNTASAPHAAPSADKDPVGEELADHARIWRVYDQVARADDKERIDTWNRGLDNLALFAGLFSAVTTAFIIEAQKDLKVDYSQLAFLALNASANGVPFVQQPFVVPSSARRITCLWVASLILSLSAALIAIMGKDWIGMYAARPVCNARQWTEMRTYRLLCVERWYMSGVIAAAPVLLHVSLLLFGAGLVLFISSDPLTHHLTLGLSLAAGGLYLVTALSAIAFPASPFKSPATQIIRGALAAALRSAGGILQYHSKRNLVATVHAAISRIIAPDLNEISTRQRRILQVGGIRILWDTNLLHRPELLQLSPIELVQSTLRRALDIFRAAPSSLHSVWATSLLALGRVRGQMRPTNIMTIVRRLRIPSFFRGSTWTDALSHRSPARLAKALSWLNDASLEPDVLRAIIIALGDLDIGGEVAPLVSADLRTRVRADIRFNWQKVDFLTLSRYVLADRNLPANPLIYYHPFMARFDLDREPHLSCEDGLAAVVMVEKGYVLSENVRKYCPQAVSQPRMFHWLLPHMGWEPLISLIHCYMTSLSSQDISDLEARFLQCFDPWMPEEYQETVQTKFDNQHGLLELLIYLIVDSNRLSEDLATSAMALVLHILRRFDSTDGEHCCLAYLFSSDRSASLWAEQSFTGLEACRLLNSLPLWTYCQYRWGDRDTPPEPGRRQSMERELARTIIEILSPARWRHFDILDGREYRNTYTGYSDLCARFLHVQLCHSHSLLTDHDKLTLIGHILKKAALPWIRKPSSRIPYEPEYPYRPECCIDILSAIVHHLTPLLQSEVNRRRIVELFGLLAHSETRMRDGSLVSWDLGEYLRSISARFSRQHSIQDSPEDELLESLTWRPNDLPIPAPAVRRFIAALQALHPLCRGSDELRAHWDRIGLPASVDDWKYETDDELVAFLKMEHEPVRAERAGVELAVLDSVVGDERDAMWWLNVCM